MDKYKKDLKEGTVLYLKCSKEKSLGKLYTRGFVVKEEADYIEVCIEHDIENHKFYKDTLEEITMLCPDYKIYLSKEELIEELESIDIIKELHTIFSTNSSKGLKVEQLRRIKSIVYENKSN